MDKKWKILWILAGVAVLLVVAFLIVGIVGACVPEEVLVDENGEKKNNEVVHSILTVFRSESTDEEPTAIPYPDQQGDSVTVTDAPNGNTEKATDAPSNTEKATDAPSNTEKATNAPVATQAPTQEPDDGFDGAVEDDDFITGNEVIVDFDDLFGEP